MMMKILNKVHDLLEDIDGVKALYSPGQPYGPYHKDRPAIVITTGDPAQERIYAGADTVDIAYKVRIHVFSEDPFTRAQSTKQGSYEVLYPIVETIIARLEQDPSLDDEVFLLSQMDVLDTGPQHAFLIATYKDIGGLR